MDYVIANTLPSHIKGCTDRICATQEEIKNMKEKEEIMERRKRNKLVIFDLNGVLVHIGGGKLKAVRPFLFDFLNFCLTNFKVGIWSSRPTEKVIDILDSLVIENYLCREQVDSFLFIKGNGPIKKLAKIWELYPQYDASNTLIFDDSIKKISMNPPGTYIYLKTWTRKDDKLSENGSITKLLKNLLTL
jgi:hypothetical protein